MSHTLFFTAFGKAINEISRNSQTFVSIDQLLPAYLHGSARTHTKTRPIIELKATFRLRRAIVQLASIPKCDQQQWRQIDQMPVAGQKLRLVNTPKEKRGHLKFKIRAHAKAKLGRSDPSAGLIKALARCGNHHVIPQLLHGQRDLPYIRADNSDPVRPQKSTSRRMHKDSTQLPHQRRQMVPTLPGILASYLRNIHGLLPPPSSKHADGLPDREIYPRISACFTDSALMYLRKRGFDGPDVMAWAWIITADTAQKSLWRLLAIASGRQRDVCEIIPTFVFLFILRRTYISPEALKLCLVHARDRLKHRASTLSPIPSWKGVDTKMDVFGGDCREGEFSRKEALPRIQMDEKSMVVMVARLLRHARLVWPFALVDISHLFSTYVHGRYGGINGSIAFPMRVETSIRLTLLFNRILFLLSLSPSVNKFLSVPYRQHAQLHLVQQMAQFQPPLPINRQGYRALAQVQLAHKKTTKERDWARLKAKSWPPWKEERTGLDVDKGAEYGTTRAQQVLTRMQEAGYSSGWWEQIARIYAGWDTDGSPTIQTRTVLSTVGAEGGHRTSRGDGALWAARIRCTRTLNEAWACFLAYGDAMNMQSEHPCREMFMKLVNDRKRWTKSTTGSSEAVNMDSDGVVLPGDGVEVLPEPISPNEVTFVRSRPPSITEFCNLLYRSGIRPSVRFLSLIVGYAESIRSGLYFLYIWTPSPSRIALAEALHNPMLTDFSKHLRAGKFIREMPYALFVALIQLLSRFSESQYPISALPNAESAAHSSSRNTQITCDRPHHRPYAGISSSPLNPLAQATTLVFYRDPKCLRPWDLLLRALAKPRATLGEPGGYDTGSNSPLQDISSWKAMLQLLHRIKDSGLSVDAEGFAMLCRALEKAIRACHMVETSAMPLSGVRGDVEAVLAEGSKVLRSVFEEIVGENLDTGLRSHISSYIEQDSSTWGPGKSSRLPMILTTFHPSVLHVYIRVLGFLGDYHRILAFVRWMARNDRDLRVIALESSNGPRLRRKSIVAARSFVERDIGIKEDGTVDGATCHHERLVADRRQVLKELRETVEGVDGWGGWPTDDEVVKYRDTSVYRANWLLAMRYHSRVAQCS